MIYNIKGQNRKMSKYEYHIQDDFEETKNLSTDLYQVLKREIGEYYNQKYDDCMDLFAMSTTISDVTYYENFAQIIRKDKIALCDKTTANLQEYIDFQKSIIKDGIIDHDNARRIGVVIDTLGNTNRSILQLVYQILEEVKFGVIKRYKSPFEIIDDYFELGINKKYSGVQDFIEDNYDYLSKAINLVYGGYNYDKKF